jgi:methylated-DNA-[protein]-cysteine S-methyltransferase
MINQTSSPIYWTLLTHEDWRIHIAATSAGLCYVGSQNQPMEELSDWVNRRFPASALIQDDDKLLPYKTEILEYLQGTRKAFSVAFDFRGTPFQVAVWNELCDIPYGKTITYTDVANQIHRPTSARAVGTAIGANPILITVPCHRVIGRNGALTGYRGGMDMKAKLLQLERESVHVEEGVRHA